MDPIDIDRSVLRRRISQRELEENNLTSLPDIPLSSDDEGSDDDSVEQSRQEDSEMSGAPWKSARTHQVPSTPLARSTTASYKSLVLDTPRPNRSLANTSHASSSSSSASSMQHFPPPLSESFSLSSNSLRDEASGSMAERSEAYKARDEGPVTSTPNTYGLHTNSSRTVLGRLGRSGDSSLLTAASGSTVKHPLANRVSDNRRFRRTIGSDDSSARFDESSQQEGEITGGMNASATQNITAIHAGSRPEQSSIGELDLSDLSNVTGSRMDENMTEASEQKARPEPGESHSQRHDGSYSLPMSATREYEDTKRDFDGRMQEGQDLEDYSEREDLLDFEVPIKESSVDEMDLSKGEPSPNPDSPLPNWVDDRRRRYRSKTPKTPSPPTPGIATRPQETPESPSTQESSGSAARARNPQGMDDKLHIEAVHLAGTPRIPSLSRSSDAGSASDESSIASTPEHAQHTAVEPSVIARTPSRTPSIYATPSSVKPELDVVEEGNEESVLEDSISYRDDYMTANALVEHAGKTPARYPQDLSRAFNRSRSEFSTPGMARGVSSTSHQFQTPLSQMSRKDYSYDLTTTPPAPNSVSFSLRDVTATTQTRVPPYSQSLETPKPKAEADKSSPALLLQSQRKAFVHSILDSTTKPRARLVGGGRRASRLSSGSSRTEAERSLVGSSSRLSLSAGQNLLDADNTADLSYVSVASSSDLTSDRRGTSSRFKGNVSVPGVMPSDVGGGGKQADAVKIAKHLSGVNGVLESENKELKKMVDELKGQIETSGLHYDPSQSTSDIQIPSFRSMRGTLMGDMSELAAKSPSITGDTSINMAPEVKDMIVNLTERVQSLETLVDEKDSTIAKLKETAALNSLPGPESMQQRKESEILESRMIEVKQMERVEQLEARLAANEEEFRNRLAQHAVEFEEIVAEKDHEMEGVAKEAASDIERLEMQIEGLAREKDRLRDVLDSDNIDEKERKLQDQIRILEDEVAKERSKVKDLQADVDTLREELASMEEELGRGEEAVEQIQQQLEAAEGAADEATKTAERLTVDLDVKKRELQEKDAGMNSARAEIMRLQEHLQVMARNHASSASALEAKAVSLTHEVNSSEARLAEVADQLRQAANNSASMEEQVAITASQLQDEQRSHAQTKAQLSSAKQQLAAKDVAEPSSSSGNGYQAMIIQLRHDLAEATDAMEKLQRTRSVLSPKVQADLDARDRRIETLIREKQDLQEQARGLRVQLDAAQRTPMRSYATMPAAASPFSAGLTMNKRVINLQTPKTPGSFAEPSWLNSSFGTDAEANALAQVEALQRELSEAGKRLDDNFERLEAAGLRQFTVADQLAQACDLATQLELQLATAKTQHAKALERLGHTKCPDCEHRFDAGDAIRVDSNQEITMFADQSTPRAGTFANKNELHGTVLSLRRQTDDLRAQWSADCERNRARITHLESTITKLLQEKTEAEVELRAALQRAQQDSESKAAELQSKRDALDRLTAASEEFRLSSSAKFHQAQQDASSLKQEVQSLESRLRRVGHSEARPSASEQAIRKDLEACRVSLSAAERESSELRRSLGRKKEEIMDADRRWTSHNQEYEQVKHDLARLENELKKHRADAMKFGQDLGDQMKKQQDAALNDTAELQSLRQGREEADRMILSLEGIISDLEANLAIHQRQPSGVRHDELAGLAGRQKVDYITERKMLTAQIRYLQVKFTREHMFRGALQVQKQYLLCLLGKFRQTEQDTLALIASMGYPAKKIINRPRYSFKGVAMVVLATVRARRAAEDWQQNRLKRDLAVEKPRKPSV